MGTELLTDATMQHMIDAATPLLWWIFSVFLALAVLGSTALYERLYSE